MKAGSVIWHLGTSHELQFWAVRIFTDFQFAEGLLSIVSEHLHCLWRRNKCVLCSVSRGPLPQ